MPGCHVMLQQISGDVSYYRFQVGYFSYQLWSIEFNNDNSKRSVIEGLRRLYSSTGELKTRVNTQHHHHHPVVCSISMPRNEVTLPK